MKIMQLNSTSISTKKSPLNLKEKGSNYSTFGQELNQPEMKLAFFSKGTIFLESGEMIFKIKNSQGVSLAQTDCFGHLLSDNFDKLFSTCQYFKYNGSPVRFTVNFYGENNQFLGKLLSESIFKNIGFGKGEGEWKKSDS